MNVLHFSITNYLANGLNNVMPHPYWPDRAWLQQHSVASKEACSVLHGSLLVVHGYSEIGNGMSGSGFILCDNIDIVDSINIIADSPNLPAHTPRRHPGSSIASDLTILYYVLVAQMQANGELEARTMT